MGLEFAIKELYSTGWAAPDLTGCENHSDGRVYPGVGRIEQEFAAAGFELCVRHVQLFDCYRAQWLDGTGHAAGAVVGQTEIEAAVYALSQLRRSLVAAGTT